MHRLVWTKLRWVFLGALTVFLAPAWALGAEGEAPGLASDLYRVLVLLAIVAAAYIITHLVLERVAERYGFVTGAEYIVLGALLGPVMGVLDAETISALTPVSVLGTGSLGLLAGLALNFRSFTPMQTRALNSGVLIALVSFAAVVALPVLAILYFGDAGDMSAWMPIVLGAGAVALVVNTGPLRAMAIFLGAEGNATSFGVLVARFCSSVGIIAFGLIFCFYNETTVPFSVEEPFVWMTWLGIHLLLGIILGVIFATFLKHDLSDDKLLTVFMGMVIFTSGFAYYLHLSPIFVNFILGVVLINVGRQAEHVHNRLYEIRRPLYIILFFFAGAGWSTDASPLWGYLLVIPYVGLRYLGRAVGSLLATRVTGVESYGAGLSRALQGAGALSVAMLLDFKQVFGMTNPSVGLMYNALLIAVVFSEIFSYPLTRRWLIDVADVATPERRASEAAQGDSAPTSGEHSIDQLGGVD